MTGCRMWARVTATCDGPFLHDVAPHLACGPGGALYVHQVAALSRSATATALSSSMASRAAWAASRRARASLAGVNGVPESAGLDGVLSGHLDRDDPAVRQFDDEKLGGPVLFLRERACTGTER